MSSNAKRLSTGPSWGVAGLLIAVIALIVVAVLPGQTTVSQLEDPLPSDWIQQLSTETALVAGTQATGGFKFAGVRLKTKTYRVDLQFLAPSDCATDRCAGPDGLIGDVGGITIDGNLIVNSRIEVSRECFGLIKVTDPWPSFPGCIAITSD